MSTYKTKKIDELEVASELKDGCQIPICQDGTAKKLTGAQIKAFIDSAIRAQMQDQGNASYYDLDLTSVVTVKSTDNPYTDGDTSFDLSEIVNAEELLSVLNAGQTVRIFFKDGFFSNRTVSTLLTDVYIGGNTDNVLAYLGATYLSMYTGRYARIVMGVTYADNAYSVWLGYERDPGGEGGSSGVHVLDIGSEELDVTKLDLSAYDTGDVLVIIQNTEVTQ